MNLAALVVGLCSPDFRGMLSGKQSGDDPVADRHRYRIDLARDDTEALRDVLEQIGEEGRTVVKILWQPKRNVPSQDWQEVAVNAGYVVVSEADHADRT